MNKWKQVDINNLKTKEDFEIAIETINKIICNLDDLEDYYFKLWFAEEYKNAKKDKEWWQEQLKEIKDEFIDFKRNNGDDKDD